MNANKQDAGGEVTNPDNVGGLRYTDHNVMNGALCDFATRWRIDGDYIRCGTCDRPQLTSYADNDFPHADFCRVKDSPSMERRPWQTYVALLAPLCRAAPAGGECQHEWEPDSDVMNARYCPKCDVTQTLPRRFRGVGELERTGYIPAGSSDERDSAPAGSGEVSRMDALYNFLMGVADLDGVSFGELHPDKRGRFWWRHELAAAYALLRKLQQGADGWRPIESAPKEDGLKILGASNAPWTQDYYPVLVYEGYRYGSNKQYFGWQAPFDHDDRAPDPTHWMPLPAPPASQDQDGGKHG